MAVLPRHIISLIDSPTKKVVTLSEMRDLLRLDSGDHSEDSLLENIIASATEYVQGISGKQLLTATYDLKLCDFPSRHIVWRKPPLQSIVSVSYIDFSGATQTVDPSDYVVEPGNEHQHGFIRPADGKCWPCSRGDEGSVIVRGVCGFGDDRCDVPEVYRQQIRMLAYSWFNNRSAVSCGGLSEMPLAFTALQEFTQRREFV